MADQIVNRLRGLVLNAVEIQNMTKWPSAMVEDYLNILDNIFILAETINSNTLLSDNSIVFSKNGVLQEDNPAFTWNNSLKVLNVDGTITGKNRVKQFFYAGL